MHCTHTFPSTITPITQLSPFTHQLWLPHHTCTSFSHSHKSSTQTLTQGEVLFSPGYISERSPIHPAISVFHPGLPDLGSLNLCLWPRLLPGIVYVSALPLIFLFLPADLACLILPIKYCCKRIQELAESAPEAAPIQELAESAPEAAPIQELTEFAPEAAPIQELTEFAPEAAPIQELTEFAPEAAPIQELTEFAPEAAPIQELTEFAPEAAPIQELTESGTPGPRWFRPVLPSAQESQSRPSATEIQRFQSAPSR